MKKILRNIVKYVLPFLFGVFLFWLLYRKLDMDSILSILKSDINYFWIFLTLVVGTLSHIFRALRWRLQLRALHIDPDMRELTNAIFGTYGLNLVIPRLGEVWRCGYIAHRCKSSFSQIFGSMVSERLFDMLMVVIVVVAVFFLQMKVFVSFLQENPGVENRIMGILTSPWLYLALAACVVAVVWFFRRSARLPWAQKLRAMVRNVWKGVASIFTMQGKFLFLFYTAAIWVCYFLQLYLCFFAFPYMTHLGIGAAFTLYALGCISMIVPVQGGVGAWHLAVIFGLGYFGITGNEAGAFALVAHGSQMLLVVLLGIYAYVSILLDKTPVSDKNEPMPTEQNKNGYTHTFKNQDL